ncbi:MAG TPA: hypothetical protein VGP47_07690, partial [Parachlamydiaceae bacterium]|nr:hypothetical protein [Parachlamydiaceae bacterium]
LQTSENLREYRYSDGNYRPTGHAEGAVTFSDDGKYIMVFSHNHSELYLFKMPSQADSQWKELIESSYIESERNPEIQICMTSWPESNLIACGSTTGIFSIMHVGNGKSVFSKQLFSSHIKQIGFSPNGHYCVVFAEEIEVTVMHNPLSTCQRPHNHL